MRTTVEQASETIVGFTLGPCVVCGQGLDQVGPEGQRSSMVFVASVTERDDGDHWSMEPVHQWCAPELPR